MPPLSARTETPLPASSPSLHRGPGDSARERPREISPTVERPISLSALSVDVEEYFHCEGFARQIRPADWPRCERRAEARLAWLGECLARHQSRATFFVLGWTVPYLAARLRELVAAGHELACHGFGHAHLSRLSPRELRADLRRAMGTLEDTLGVTARGYRAPTFSITRATAWALDLLVELGFEYDASVFPIHHDRYGVPGAPAGPFLALTPGGAQILEFPPLTVECTRHLRLPVGGGGYARLLPGWLLRACVAAQVRRGRPLMLYLHPWELDPDQPRIPAGRLAQWRHRVGLRGTAGKLEALLGRFRFETAGRVLAAVRVGGALPCFALHSGG